MVTARTVPPEDFLLRTGLYVKRRVAAAAELPPLYYRYYARSAKSSECCAAPQSCAGVLAEGTRRSHAAGRDQ